MIYTGPVNMTEQLRAEYLERHKDGYWPAWDTYPQCEYSEVDTQVRVIQWARTKDDTPSGYQRIVRTDRVVFEQIDTTGWGHHVDGRGKSYEVYLARYDKDKGFY